MSIKYIDFDVQVHGLSIEDTSGVELLKNKIGLAIKEILIGEDRSVFGYRDEFDSDIIVTIQEYAGETPDQ